MAIYMSSSDARWHNDLIAFIVYRNELNNRAIIKRAIQCRTLNNKTKLVMKIRRNTVKIQTLNFLRDIEASNWTDVYRTIWLTIIIKNRYLYNI